MAETKVENKICQECGADVRPGSLFCYSCGSAVPVNLETDNEVKNHYETGRLEFNGKYDSEANSLKNVGTINAPIEKPFGSPLEERAKIGDKKAAIQEGNKVKASAVRQKARAPEKNRVEVVWEEPDNSTNLWFFVASMVLLLFAIVILLAAFYIR